jgi:hypothetical protein
MRNSAAWDATNVTAAGGIVYSWYAGVDWPTLAAFLAALYGFVILAEKLTSITTKLLKWRKSKR